MWVLLEGDPRSVEVDVDQSKYASWKFNLDRCYKVTQMIESEIDIIR